MVELHMKGNDSLFIDPGSTIYVAGHTGMVGSAITRRLRQGGNNNLLLRSHTELDLMNQGAVRLFFQQQQIDCVVLAAAMVGGIMANSSYPADFIYQNLVMQNNVIHGAWQSGVNNLVFLGSSCIYPRLASQPMKEEYLLSGPLEPTNEPYAVAKIAGIKMCEAYNRQYGTKYFAVMPTNLYGPGDHYDLHNSHVLPALIRKMSEAKERGDDKVIVWGTGTPRREFLHCDDLADAVVFLLSSERVKVFASFEADGVPLINIGCGKDISIRELADLIKNIVGFSGTIEWDKDKPDGTPRKLLDITRLQELGWKPKVSLQQGIQTTYAHYKSGLES
jgi:GDP-L-fucose synthase